MAYRLTRCPGGDIVINTSQLSMLDCPWQRSPVSVLSLKLRPILLINPFSLSSSLSPLLSVENIGVAPVDLPDCDRDALASPFFPPGGEYRSRTDDLLLAKQAL